MQNWPFANPPSPEGTVVVGTNTAVVVVVAAVVVVVVVGDGLDVGAGFQGFLLHSLPSLQGVVSATGGAGVEMGSGRRQSWPWLKLTPKEGGQQTGQWQ